MTTRVMINPNLRLDRDYTMVDLVEDVHGDMPREMDEVQVYEPEAHLTGRAWVSHIDSETMTLYVDWRSLRVDEGGAVEAGSVRVRDKHFFYSEQHRGIPFFPRAASDPESVKH